MTKHTRPPPNPPSTRNRPVQEPRLVFPHFGLAADGEGAGVAKGPAAEDADFLSIALVAAALDGEFGMVPAFPAHDRDLGIAGAHEGEAEMAKIFKYKKPANSGRDLSP